MLLFFVGGNIYFFMISWLFIVWLMIVLTHTPPSSSYHHSFLHLKRFLGKSKIFREFSSCLTPNEHTQQETTKNEEYARETNPLVHISEKEWRHKASEHKNRLLYELYPPTAVQGKKVRQGKHQVNDHPIYNFLHRYYRFSVGELSKYSPGMNVILEGVTDKDIKSGLISSRYFVYDNSTQSGYYSPDVFQELVIKGKGKYKSTNFTHNYQILQSTSQKTGFFGCFGMHEWAMLYGNEHSPCKSSHQKALQLRVTQEVINEMIEKFPLRCTHYDAWRFFHEEAQTRNAISSMTRYSQVDYDQPACIHANMDLFKYAYQLYPLVSSDVLLQAVTVAILARKIDIRASPYNVSHITGCEHTLAVETSEGRREYIQEQEALYALGMPLRQHLLTLYDQAFGPAKDRILSFITADNYDDDDDGRRCSGSGSKKSSACSRDCGAC